MLAVMAGFVRIIYAHTRNETLINEAQ